MTDTARELGLLKTRCWLIFVWPAEQIASYRSRSHFIQLHILC